MKAQELSPILVPTPSEITKLLQSKQVGQFAAMKLQKYKDEISQIGKVKNVREKEIQVEWWIGRWNNTWRMWKTKGAVNIETVPKTAILMAPLKLSNSSRIDTVTKLDLYDSV